MDVIVPAFLAAFLAEWGDKTQLVVALLAARSRRPGTVFAALVIAALISSAVSAYAGTLIVGMIDLRARSLLLALSLLFAGASGLVVRRDPALGSPRVPLLIAAILLCLAAELGDRTQFITFALSARFESPMLAAAASAAGIIAAALPAVLAGVAIKTLVPLRSVRLVAAALFLAAGFLIAVNALRLA